MFFPYFAFFALVFFSVITFEPIKIQTRSAPQNDQNFSFVKDIHVVGKKNDQKWS